jgi:hypothetical protein
VSAWYGWRSGAFQGWYGTTEYVPIVGYTIPLWSTNAWAINSWSIGCWGLPITTTLVRVSAPIAARLPNWMQKTSGSHFRRS